MSRRIVYKIKNFELDSLFEDTSLLDLVRAAISDNKLATLDGILLGCDTDTIDIIATPLTDCFEKLNVKYHLVTINSGEINKTLESVTEIYESFFGRMNGTRKTVIWAAGGGMVSNVFGFCASTIFRGVRLVQMPTTFLNAHDAAGSSLKQGFNFLDRKNVIGSYYQPSLVLHFGDFFKTLKNREFRAGTGELLKNGFLFGGRHMELVSREDFSILYQTEDFNLKRNILAEALHLGLEAKFSLLDSDPFERCEAVIFEFGHTIGHALELVLQDVSHGECVALGVLGASRISSTLISLPSEIVKLCERFVHQLIPQHSISTNIYHNEIKIRAMKKVQSDNKRGYVAEIKDHIPMILLSDIGKVNMTNGSFLTYVPHALVYDTISDLVDEFCAPHSYSLRMVL